MGCAERGEGGDVERGGRKTEGEREGRKIGEMGKAKHGGRGESRRTRMVKRERRGGRKDEKKKQKRNFKKTNHER